MANQTTQSKEVLECLNELFQSEMAGIIRYLHYSFMIMGHNRIPIQKWFRTQAEESMAHAIAVGEKITSYGGHPPAISANVEESNLHTISQMLKECLSFEQEALDLYCKLAGLAKADIALEEFARGFIKDETEHLEEVRKMLRVPE